MEDHHDDSVGEESSAAETCHPHLEHIGLGGCPHHDLHSLQDQKDDPADRERVLFEAPLLVEQHEQHSQRQENHFC